MKAIKKSLEVIKFISNFKLVSKNSRELLMKWDCDQMKVVLLSKDLMVGIGAERGWLIQCFMLISR